MSSVSISQQSYDIAPGKIGPIQEVGDDVYTARAVAPTGETFFLAIEPIDGRDKWDMYKDSASALIDGHGLSYNIGSLVEIGFLAENEVELQEYLSKCSDSEYWTSNESAFRQLREKFAKRKITQSSARALLTVSLASRGINTSEQTHIVYASKQPISGRFSVLTDQEGFGAYIDSYSDIIMCVGVKVHNLVENRGIFRNPLSSIEGGYGGISMMLHSFTCLAVQKIAPQVTTFKVRPLERMSEIILKSIPNENITVDGISGVKYDKGFRFERNIEVPVKILAELHKNTNAQ